MYEEQIKELEIQLADRVEQRAVVLRDIQALQRQHNELLQKLNLLNIICLKAEGALEILRQLDAQKSPLVGEDDGEAAK